MMTFGVQACAEPVEHPPELTNPEILGDIPPTYDYDQGQFTVTLPMLCADNAERIYKTLSDQGYALVFLGQTQSQAGGDLFVNVFMHKKNSDYYVLLTNPDAGGVCEVTSGDFGAVFPIDKIGI